MLALNQSAALKAAKHCDSLIAGGCDDLGNSGPLVSANSRCSEPGRLASGVIVLYGLLNGKALAGWTVLFLATMILTSVSGFPLPPFGFDPPRAVGILSLILLAAAVLALYVFRLAGPWRWIFVAAAVAALYFDIVVGIVQAFAKLSFLHALAPTQSDPPFVVVQLIALAIFIALGVLAARRFHPAHAANA